MTNEIEQIESIIRAIDELKDTVDCGDCTAQHCNYNVALRAMKEILNSTINEEIKDLESQLPYLVEREDHHERQGVLEMIGRFEAKKEEINEDC